MADTPSLQELLDELLDSDSTPEEVCGPWPELLPELRSRWLRVRRVRDELDALFPPTPGPGVRPSAFPWDATDLPRIPGYEVEAVLGRGGMGVVFRARHLRLNRLVALKMALAGAYAGPRERERFRREAETVAGLRHPNVVQLHDVGDWEGRPYFTMELVDGGSLAQKLDGVPWPPREAASLLGELAEAVEAAHRGGVVHRDLKPANILLTAEGVPRVSDFGLARRLEGEAGLTRTGTALGTPAYMAPEQARGPTSAVGPAADIYALGAILYELLAGRPPFRGETAAETVLQVLSRDPVPPSHLNAKVPLDLETVCLKCLQKEPCDRYPTSSALAEDLRRFLQGEAIAARPERGMERLARRVRRRPALSAALAGCTLLGVALAGVGLWLVGDRAAAAREAEAERAATERAAGDDLSDMARWLRKSSWPEGRAALERARGRLGDGGSIDLRRRLDRGARDLELVARLEATRLTAFDGIPGFPQVRPDAQYEEAFREAGLGRVDDDPGMVARRVRTSDVRDALVAALDHWSVHGRDPRSRGWALDVARRADPDPTGWRDRARDPAIRSDQTALAEVIRAASAPDEPVSLLLALDALLDRESKERLPFLRRVQRAHPGDFWANITLGGVLYTWEKRPAEAARYFQAAVSLRPRSVLGHFRLGLALEETGSVEEAAEQFRRAVDIDPTSYFCQTYLAVTLAQMGRHDEAVDRLEAAVRANPNSAGLHTFLGSRLEVQGRTAEALTRFRQALALAPDDVLARIGLRSTLVQLGRGEEARVAWRDALGADPPGHDAWYGYAEFCLFLGQEEEYRRARRVLLRKFDATTDPLVAQRTATACLLGPSAGDELRQAAELAGRAAAVDPSNYQVAYPYFLFALGLAEYRQGRLDRAVSAMRGEAARMPGPAPHLVLAMALHRSGRSAEAREALAEAVLSHDWSADRARSPDDWSVHALRREAEAMILPDLPALLDGRHEPRDVDERSALLGVCQFTNRTRATARLYSQVFAEAPHLAEDHRAGHRYRAASAAALAGSGRGTDAAGLDEEERRRWRDQARRWLRADLDAWDEASVSTPAARDAQQTLADWRADPAFVGVRDAGDLARLPEEERQEWLALWSDVESLLSRTANP
jgi:serine/threonine-protein kinase